MDTKYLICVVGTRPEAIKMAPVIKRFQMSKEFKCGVLATGQHTDMLDQALSHFSILPDFNLKIMKEKQSLDYLTSSVLEGVGQVLDKECPDMVLVHGDTTTTFASALAAFYRKIPVGHVEAGLRSHDPYLPFPEELNRILADDLSTLFFAPTIHAHKNLISEGRDRDKVFITGNTVIDSLFWTIENLGSYKPDCVAHLSPNNRIVLVTAHRRESWGQPMTSICKAIKTLLSQYDNFHVIFPVHKNPEVRKIVYSSLSDQKRLTLCEPLSYPDFVRLMQLSYMILSDSGGVQEEATALQKPLLILRYQSERPEATEQGTGILVGTNTADIIRECRRLIEDREHYKEITDKPRNPFGDGKAAERIENIIRSFCRTR